MEANSTIDVKNMGKVLYERWQQQQLWLVESRQRDDIGDTLFLMEHPAVFTLGRSVNASEDLPAEYNTKREDLRGVAVEKVERGGGIMLHNPGQLVCYPIVKLKNRGINLRRLMWLMEETIIQTLREFGIKGFRQPEIHPGVWTEKGKIGFIGIAIRRGVLFHGFAVNVNNDLTPFNWIAPCGLKNALITSVKDCSGEAVNLRIFRQTLGSIFCQLWGKIILTASPLLTKVS